MDERFEILANKLVSQMNSIISDKLSTPTFLRPPDMSFLSSNLSTTVKEPCISKAQPERVQNLCTWQRFNTPEWNSVRYADAQKKFLAQPGFTELKINEELRRLDDPSPLSTRSAQSERSLAALSNALMAQNEALNSALKNLSDWAGKPDSLLTVSTLCEKLKSLFDDNSSYKTISKDILQIICGKRAEALEARRGQILKTIRDKFIREDLEKIPPSNEYIFDAVSLSAYVQKIGGVDKLTKQSRQFTSASQANPPSAPRTGSQPFHGGSSTNKTKPTDKKNFKGKRTNFDSKKRGGGHNEGYNKGKKPYYRSNHK